MSIGVVIKVALTAYSAVSAVKALKEGNIMGAVMGGFGAYMGLSNLGAFGTATGGDALAATAEMGAEQAGMLAEQTAEFGVEGALMTADSAAFNAGGVLDSIGTAEIGQEASNYGNVLKDGSTEIGTKIDLGASSKLGGLGDTISSTWDSVVEAGKGIIDSAGDLISTEDGSLIAKAGEAVGGTGNLMKLGGMAMDYMGKEKALEAKEKAAEEGYQRSVAEAARKRSSVGAAPTYVYDFSRKEGVV